MDELEKESKIDQNPVGETAGEEQPEEQKTEGE
jgi:hypothetical protein